MKLRSIYDETGFATADLELLNANELQLIYAAVGNPKYKDLFDIVHKMVISKERRLADNTKRQIIVAKAATKRAESAEAEVHTLKQRIEELTKQIVSSAFEFENSELLRAGKWLVETLKLTGDARGDKLAEKQLVHHDDVKQLEAEVSAELNQYESELDKSAHVIHTLEGEIDRLRKSNRNQSVVNMATARHRKAQ